METPISLCLVEAYDHFYTTPIDIEIIIASKCEKVTCSGEDKLLTENEHIKTTKQ